MLRSGSSYLSASELVLTFGLAHNEKADAVEIRWPSGEVRSAFECARRPDRDGDRRKRDQRIPRFRKEKPKRSRETSPAIKQTIPQSAGAFCRPSKKYF